VGVKVGVMGVCLQCIRKWLIPTQARSQQQSQTDNSRQKISAPCSCSYRVKFVAPYTNGAYGWRSTDGVREAVRRAHRTEQQVESEGQNLTRTTASSPLTQQEQI
jgi:hypothetical protein